MAKLIHSRTPMRVEFSHTDMAGIVHFSEYFRYMEAAEHAFFREHGMSIKQELNGEIYSWPRVSCKFDFKIPLRFEDTFDACITLSQQGASSLTFTCEIVKNDQVCAVGSSTSVCCKVAHGRLEKTPIPDEIRRRLPVSL